MLFIQIAVAATSSSEANITLDGCESKCGNLDVPYPFGTSYGCHRQGGFKVKCDHAYIPHKLFLEGDDMDLEVLEISIQNRMVRARATVWPFAAGNISDMVVKVVPANLQPYVLSTDRNSIVIVGCGFQASVRTMMSSLQGETVFASCAPSCTQQKHQPNRCEDDGCCELAIPTGLTSFTVQFSWLDQNAHVQMSCTVAETRPEFGCISKNSECLDSTSSAYGYVCQCKDGYNGNPYLVS
nr:unnamed protein product [Digitaria exilis]